MRIVLQVVAHASVSVEGKEVAHIGRGFLLLVGLTPGDTPEIAHKMADKVLKLRVFPDENGKTNLGLKDVGGEVLSVSQFTLYGSLKEGNRPSYVAAMRPDEARALYADFYAYLQANFPSVQGGVFQADMKVDLLNDGPMTFLMDSKELVK